MLLSVRASSELPRVRIRVKALVFIFKLPVRVRG